MSRRLAAQTIKHLKNDPEHRSWERLPEELLEKIAGLPPRAAIDVAHSLWKEGDHPFLWAAYTVLHRHPVALRRLRVRDLEQMGDGVDSWGAVDVLASLAGPAWREGRITDYRVYRWASSPNRWWRRTALVCTVFLNRRSVGGCGDTSRTLAVCELLVADRDDMVVKGLSWALRDLLKRDRKAVERFLWTHDDLLAARVKREVRNKLTTAVKNPRRR